jgi:hypothetical protein
MPIEIGFEIEQLVFEIHRGPEQRAIEVLAANHPDQPFHKRMGERNIGNSFDLSHLQDPQIGLPLRKLEQGIMVGAEALGPLVLSAIGAVEHPAKSGPIDGSGLNPEANDTACELVHDDQDPESPQSGRFAPE